MSDDIPECPVCAGTLFVFPLAKLGMAREYSCAACWTVFNGDTGTPTGNVAERWRTDDHGELLRHSVEHDTRKTVP